MMQMGGKGESSGHATNFTTPQFTLFHLSSLSTAAPKEISNVWVSFLCNSAPSNLPNYLTIVLKFSFFRSGSRFRRRRLFFYITKSFIMWSQNVNESKSFFFLLFASRSLRLDGGREVSRSRFEGKKLSGDEKWKSVAMKCEGFPSSPASSSPELGRVEAFPHSSSLFGLFSVTVCAHLLDLHHKSDTLTRDFITLLLFVSFAQWSFSFFYLFSMNFFFFLSFFFFILFCLHRGNFAITSSVPAQQGSPLWGFLCVIIQNYYPDCDSALCTTTHWWNNFLQCRKIQLNWKLFSLVDISGKLNTRGWSYFFCVSGKPNSGGN